MPSTIISKNGKRIDEIELLDIFPASEGMICQYYGRIGSGKTYAATADILELLRRGKVVYANWKINYSGYDERKSKFRIFTSIVFPWINRFYNFPKENLIYFEISDSWAVKQGYKDFDTWVMSRTDCYMFADEGHVWIDSYAGTRIPMERRNIALHTRHFNRCICIITQRPTAIHVTMRANVNIFYKCEKIFSWGNIRRFKRSEFQEMLNESVDEDEEKCISVKHYWGRKRIFNSYDTKYLRGDQKQSQKVMFEAYKVGFFAKLRLLTLGLEVVDNSKGVKSKGVIELPHGKEPVIKADILKVTPTIDKGRTKKERTKKVIVQEIKASFPILINQ